MTNYISLHNHTDFSILNSLMSSKDLFNRVKELGQTAVAITDYGTLAAAWDALKISKQTGIKLIIGCEFYFVDNITNKDTKLRLVVLLAKNANGYKNLLGLTKKGFENHSIIMKKAVPIIDWDMLKEFSQDIVCLTGCGNGIIGQLLNTKRFEEAEQTMLRLHDIFGDNLGIEVQAHNLQRNATHYTENVNQFFTNTHLIRLATKHNLRIVPTTSSFYTKKEDAETHDVLLAIGSMQPVYSNARVKYNTTDMYLKTGDEIKSFFSRNFGEEFAEKMCENSIYFANLCENADWIDPRYKNTDSKELPVFPVEDEKDYDEFKNWWSSREDLKKLQSDEAYLRFKCEIVLKAKIHPDKQKQYQERLDEELDVFSHCGVSSYMLIVADFVKYARENNIPVGPGRGSCGGSIASFFLGIHAADPIKYGLVFQRFFSKLRDSLADIDMDFSKEKRYLILEYLSNKYGKDKFAQISNFIYITPKVYVRDVSRSCDLKNNKLLSVKLGTDIADIIPKKDINDKEVRSYNEIIKSSPLFVEYTKQYPVLAKYSNICGKPRSLGIHAAGAVISKRSIHTIVPIRIDKDNILSVQLDKKGVEEIGLVKMDILGIETLDIIECINLLIKNKYNEVPVIDYDEYDIKTYNLISNGNTLGVFQFGTSAGTIDLCKKIKPKSIEDLAIITSLARPVTKNIREDFVKAREKNKMAKVIHPSLENSLKDTYGFPLYDESLLILAKDVAGWDLDEADKLRKLTKEKGKNPANAEKWRNEFIEGAVKNKIDKEIAIKIWHDIVEPFGGYAFCKSLSVFETIDIYTSEGKLLETKTISEVVPGDLILSRDEQLKENILVKVLNKHDHGILPLYEVELTTGEKVKCTMNHKFRVEETGEMLPLWKIIKEELTIIVNTVNIRADHRKQ